jgi:hypothetical protein
MNRAKIVLLRRTRGSVESFLSTRCGWYAEKVMCEKKCHVLSTGCNVDIIITKFDIISNELRRLKA